MVGRDEPPEVVGFAERLAVAFVSGILGLLIVVAETSGNRFAWGVAFAYGVLLVVLLYRRYGFATYVWRRR